MFPIGVLKEVHVTRVSFFSDSEGIFYELLTEEGYSILVGTRAGQATVEIESPNEGELFDAYGGPQAERLLQAVREMFLRSKGYNPEEETKSSHSHIEMDPSIIN